VVGLGHLVASAAGGVIRIIDKCLSRLRHPEPRVGYTRARRRCLRRRWRDVDFGVFHLVIVGVVFGNRDESLVFWRRGRLDWLLDR
jgi:hypothetical protein